MPPKIPSTFVQTPIVKRQNIALYNSSATKLDSKGSFNNNSSFEVLNTYMLQYKSSLSITAKLLGLRENVDFSIAREEFFRRQGTPSGDRTARESQILGSVNNKILEATIYRQMIIDTVTQLARQDSVRIRTTVNQSVLDSIFKEELNVLINNISKSTAR